METVILIGFLVAGLLTSFSLIFFSEHFSPFSSGVVKNMNSEYKQKVDYLKKIKHNFSRIKQVHA